MAGRTAKLRRVGKTVSIQTGRLVVEPQRQRLYTLDELLAQCKPSVARSKEDHEWLNGKSAGRELI